MGIIIKNILIEVDYFISMVKHYHRPLQQVCSIITTKIHEIQPNLVFQIFFIKV